MFAAEMMRLCRVKEPMRHSTVLLVSIVTGQVLPPTSLWLSVALGEYNKAQIDFQLGDLESDIRELTFCKCHLQKDVLEGC